MLQDDGTHQFVGHWINDDKRTNSCIGISIGVPSSSTTENPKIVLATYGKCHPSWSVTIFDQKVSLVEDGFKMNANYGFKRELLTFEFHNGKLSLTTDKVFIDGSGRAPQHFSNTFSLAEGIQLGDFDALGNLLTAEFYVLSGERGGWNGDKPDIARFT